MRSWNRVGQCFFGGRMAKQSSTSGTTTQQVLTFNRVMIASIGIGLAGSLWVVDSITDTIGDWMPAILVGSVIAWGYSRLTRLARSTAMVTRKPVTLDSVKTALIEAEKVVGQVTAELQTLATDATDEQTAAKASAALRSQLQDILIALKRNELRFAIVGGKGVGKTSLHHWLETNWLQSPVLQGISQKLQLLDTPELFSNNPRDSQTAITIAKRSDLVLFVLQGDLMESELKLLQNLNQAYRRTVIVLNKQDQYLPKEQDELLAKIRDRVAGMITKEDVIAIATQPRPIKVRQHQDDNSIKEWIEEPQPQVQPLFDRLQHILLNDAQALMMASALGDAEALKLKAHQQLNLKRRAIAMPLIDRAQWIVAGTAFATPFPALDLLATAAVNGQMVIELSQLYQQKFSLDQAKQIAKNMAEIMIKLGIVEVSTQAIASVLKTNAFTYMAGGALQGISGAYLTRIAGLSLMTYWEEECSSTANSSTTKASTVKLDKLSSIVKTVFQQNQRTNFLQGFVTTALGQLFRKQPIEAPDLASQSNPTPNLIITSTSIPEESLEVLPR